jgi:hypothetical protein
VLTVEAVMQRLQASARTAFEAEDKLIEVLKREGLLVENSPAGRLK